MKLERELKKYKDLEHAAVEEEKIKTVIKMSKEAFYAKEQESSLTYCEFLQMQLKFIKKRWWSLQLLLLAGLWNLMAYTESGISIQKEMGVVSILFIILVIPELWKNRNSQSLEIESASYYSLRQIYAARMVLFAIVDMVMLSIFCCTVWILLRVSVEGMIIQFIIPMTVTACICFQTLCSKWRLSEAAAIGFCLFWSAVWLLIILNKKIYEAITLPVWFILLAVSIIYLCISVYRTLNNTDRYWEEDLTWN